MTTRLELDHIFVFVEPGETTARDFLESLGLDPTYERVHPGQGTANVCYAFDNAFLELLWVRDEREVTSPIIAPTRLAERAAGGHHICPFGLAWRSVGPHPPSLETWLFQPPYLPEGRGITCATFATQPTLPFAFAALGESAPRDWDARRRGTLQRAAGFDNLQVTLRPPRSLELPKDLVALGEDGLFDLEGSELDKWSARISFSGVASTTLIIERTDSHRTTLRVG